MTNPAEKIVTFKMKYQNKIPKRMEQKKRQISLSFDTSQVTSMSNMFLNCKNLEGLDLSNFNTSHVTDMSNMFSN